MLNSFCTCRLSSVCLTSSLFSMFHSSILLFFPFNRLTSFLPHFCCIISLHSFPVSLYLFFCSLSISGLQRVCICLKQCRLSLCYSIMVSPPTPHSPYFTSCFSSPAHTRMLKHTYSNYRLSLLQNTTLYTQQHSRDI